jgi:hypothetical protein
MDNKLLLAGRVLYGGPLLIFGAMHFGKTEMMAGRVLAGWPMGGVHIPHVAGATDEGLKTVSMVQVFKDTMLAGGALLIAALAARRSSPERSP